MTIQNSTITRNAEDSVIIGNIGTMTIVDSTIANNFVGRSFSFPGDGAVSNISGTLDITNSTISGNVPLPTDLTGDPALGAFIDDGAPGNGRFPLQAGSPAIGAGNVCPTTDQLGTPRLGACDIGPLSSIPW